MTAPTEHALVPPTGVDDSARAPEPTNRPASGSIDPTRRQIWRRVRGPLAVAGVLLIAGVVIAALQSRSTGGQLDPRSARQTGGRALAVLLAHQGVDVRRTDTLDEAVADAGPTSTLLVTQPDLLSRRQLRQIARTQTRHLVLFQPGDEPLAVLAPKVVPAGDALTRTRAPGCALPAAVRAGAIRVDGPMYRAIDKGTTCYGDGTRGGMVRLGVRRGDDAGGASVRTVDVIGTPVSFTNARLADDGHAALALNVLGDHSRLVWYVPSLADAAADSAAPPDPFALLPPGVRFGVGQVAVAVVLLMLVHARRLGPVVSEPLPVVVRASETVEGRARLYHRARARDRSAEVLRAAATARMSARMGLPAGAPPDQVVAAVSARTSRPPATVAALLSGGPPPDDRSLVRLADELDSLEQEVRRS